MPEKLNGLKIIYRQMKTNNPNRDKIARFGVPGEGVKRVPERSF